MARGGLKVASPAPALPKVYFEKVDVEQSTQPLGLVDQQQKSFGFNNPMTFVVPTAYIRHIETLDRDLARQVEYDMDEQDKEWLDAVNIERKKDQLDTVSYSSFEVIMDRLEKEWFDLTKNMPKLDMALPSEDSTCAICDDSEGENSNAIVFCDGCNLAVHQDCYGVPYIPEGQWLCRKCTVSPEVPVSCVLCPNEGGAFKQTTNGEWVHLLCAIWVPETRVANEVFMEPITGMEKISKQRWKLRCNVCDIREGACIQCAKTSCFLAFHATCARKEKLLLPMKAAQGSEPVVLTCYCDRHLPKEQQDSRAAALAADAGNEESEGDGDEAHDARLSKTARAHAKTYKPGPPLVPAIIMDRIAHYITKIPMRKKPELLAMVCRYWSLKREARRGAPLLKRLHLEPWTANAGNKILTQEEKEMKLEQLILLKENIDRVKQLADLTYQRERIKQKQALALQEVLQSFVLSYTDGLRHAFESIMLFDKKGYFKTPVLKSEVPDYYDVITNPMCWSIIDEKLNRHEYWDVQTFKHDVDLLVDNALFYNKPGSLYHKTALKVKEGAQAKFAEMESQMRAQHPPELSVNPNPNGSTSADVNGDDAAKTTPPVGDLEPPLELIELLFSTNAIADDLDIILDDDPLSSLFDFSLPRMKPPPPPPPPPPPKPPKAPKAPKTKRGKKQAGPGKKQAVLPEASSGTTAIVSPVEGAQPQQAESEEVQAKYDPSIDVSAPRTRRAAAAAAAAAAVEAEADIEVDIEMAPPPKEEADVVSLPSSPVHTPARRGRPRKYPTAPVFASLHEPGAGLSSSPAPEFERDEDGNQIIIVDEPSGNDVDDTEAKRPGKKKRLTSLPNPADTVPMVEHVDDQQSFKMFNEGWILPANTRRGGRPPMEKPEILARPKKKPRIGQAPSRLSMVSTAPSENQTLDLLIHEDEEKLTPPADEDALGTNEDAPPPLEEIIVNAGNEPMDVDMEESGVPDPDETEYSSRGPTPAMIPPEQFTVSPHGAFIPPTTLIKGPDGTVIIEELDTPAIRREKNKREKARRAEEQRRIVAAQTPITGVLPHPAVLSGPGVPGPAPFSRDDPNVVPKAEPQGIGKVEGESELSVPGEVGAKNYRVIGNGMKLEGGVLVWAKAGRYPWWPAVIYEDDDPQVPPNILAECRLKRKKINDPDVQIIRFFDKTDSWQFLPLKFLKEFGEDKDLDGEMIAANSRFQTWKNGSVRADCREAYRRALAEMETDNENPNIVEGSGLGV